MYEESQKNAIFQKDKLNQEIQKNKRLIEMTKSSSPQIKINEFFEKNIVPKPNNPIWRKWIFPSLFMMMIMISIFIVFNHRDNLNLGEVKNYEVKLYGDSAYQYSGEIKDNLPNGQGKANYIDKRNYEGTFCEGLRHGKGKMVFPDQATTYNGDYVHGIAEGQGKMHYSNGNYYIGKWKNNKQNGLGTYYDSNGNELYHGLWKNGKPIDKKR